MISEPLTLTLVFSINLATGFVLGTLFYAGLWWTTSRVIIDSWSALWFIVSFIVRMTVVITGFYLFTAPEWQNLLMCLLGFLIGRLIVSLTLQYPSTDDKPLT